MDRRRRRGRCTRGLGRNGWPTEEGEARNLVGNFWGFGRGEGCDGGGGRGSGVWECGEISGRGRDGVGGTGVVC